MNAKVVLLAVSIDHHTKDKSIIVFQDDETLRLPQGDVVGGCLASAERLLQSITGLTGKWLHFSQGEAIDDDDSVLIPYSCLVPREFAQLNDGFHKWMSLSEAIKLDFKNDILKKVCIKI